MIRLSGRIFCRICEVVLLFFVVFIGLGLSVGTGMILFHDGCY